MRIIAGEDINPATDITPWITPLVYALKRSQFGRYCASCFHILGQNSVHCGTTSCPVKYCSSSCLKNDETFHTSSQECGFLSSFDYSMKNADYIELYGRLALRFNCLVNLSPPRDKDSTRLYGLLGLKKEIAPLLDGLDFTPEIFASIALEKMDMLWRCLCVVVTNAIVIESDSVKYGLGLYPVTVSWFNHQCTPDAVWRFNHLEPDVITNDSQFLVLPEGSGLKNMKRFWDDEVCSNGPKIKVRTIRRVDKDAEVFVSYYTASELYLDHYIGKEKAKCKVKYYHGFWCKCQRCMSSLEIDRILWGEKGSKLGLDIFISVEELHKKFEAGDMEEPIYSFIDTFKKVKSMHRNSLQFHVYMVNSYQVVAKCLQHISHSKSGDQAFQLKKSSTAFRLLRCGALFYLFKQEPLILFVLKEDLVQLGLSLIMLQKGKLEDRKLKCCHDTLRGLSFEESQFKDVQNTSEGLWKCICDLSLRVWPYLIEQSPMLEDVGNPCDFSCLKKQTKFEKKFSSMKMEAKFEKGGSDDVDLKDICRQMGMHCLLLASYLQFVGQGPDHLLQFRKYFVDEVQKKKIENPN